MSPTVRRTGESDLLLPQVQGIDLKVEIHPKVQALLHGGQWAAARLLLTELRQLLEAEGFQPDGLRVIAGSSWRARFKGTEG